MQKELITHQSIAILTEMDEYLFIESLLFSALELLVVEDNRFPDDIIGALSITELQHLNFLLLQFLVVLKEPE